jgi:hypothetical protein
MSSFEHQRTDCAWIDVLRRWGQLVRTPGFAAAIAVQIARFLRFERFSDLVVGVGESSYGLENEIVYFCLAPTSEAVVS